MDIFDEKKIRPMLIASSAEPFNDPRYLFELKWDGERCLAYADVDATELINKRGKRLTPNFPELAGLHLQLGRCRCILDGELVLFRDGHTDFAGIVRRSLQVSSIRRAYDAQHNPASFVAFDILYLDGQSLLSRPLIERKALLEEVVSESERLSVSRYIEEKGIELYALTVQQNLEGVVGKRMDSVYIPGKTTHSWVKFKNLLDGDYLVCGYILSTKKNTAKLALGQYNEKGEIVYKGHAEVGTNTLDFGHIESLPRAADHPYNEKPNRSNDKAVWLEPVCVCTVNFMDYTPSGKMRQPQFKGLRLDKTPQETTEGDWQVRF